MRILVPLLACSLSSVVIQAPRLTAAPTWRCRRRWHAAVAGHRAAIPQPADVYTLPSNLPAMDASHRGDVVAAPRANRSPPTVPTRKRPRWAIPARRCPLDSGPGVSPIAACARGRRRRQRQRRRHGGGAGGAGEAARGRATRRLQADPTVGLAPACATSYTNLADGNNLNDYSASIIPLVAYGYTVVIPDYEGFAYGQPPGYFHAEDEAYAILDDAAPRDKRSAHRQFDKVVLVGMLAGRPRGHRRAALRELVRPERQPPSASPPCTRRVSMASFGAITSPLAMYNTSANSTAILFAMWYFYAEGELLDGPGMGQHVSAGEARFGAHHARRRPRLLRRRELADAGHDDVGLLLFDVPQRRRHQLRGEHVQHRLLLPDATKWLARWVADCPPLDPMAGAAARLGTRAAIRT